MRDHVPSRLRSALAAAVLALVPPDRVDHVLVEEGRIEGLREHAQVAGEEPGHALELALEQ
eukprot:10646325-Alexandrium_andersonii.AAC.1